MAGIQFPTITGLFQRYTSLYGGAYFLHRYTNLYQFKCSEQKAPDNSEVHRSIENCGFSVWNLLHVALEFVGGY